MIGAITAGLFSSGTVASTNSYESISTVSVGAGGQSSISFTSIPSTYKNLQIRWLCLNSSSQTDTKLTFNSDTGANYSVHQLYGDGSTTGASASTSQTATIVGIGGTSTAPAAFVCDILDYTNTNKYKTVRSLGGNDINAAGGYVMFKSGLWMSTAAVTTITISPVGGNFNQYSSFALYGIKG